MKNFKKVLALVLAVATLLSFATFAGAYTDVNFGDDYAEAIEVLSAIGVLEGNTGYAGAYRPKETITREEAAKLIAIFDNGSTDIADLYTATNPFADVVGRWSASYVGYCYKAGIVVGPRANMFEPKENVTGTQFLKMALTVLDLDAEKEALVGPSWDVNALKLANDIGLTDGLAANWKPEAALTRGEAAQIMYNTLCAETYKYGSAIHYFGPDPNDSDKASFITVAGAYPSGHYLYEKWGLTADTTYDAFERPYHTWKKGSKTIISVMYPVLAQYTVRVDGCKVLVDLGVKKTDLSTKLDYDFYRNGVGAPASLYDGKLFHTTAACNAEDILFGSQGTLTQVFKIGKTYRITSIETWLAKVTDVSKVTTSKDGHKLGSANVTVDPLDGSHAWENRNEYCEYAFDHELGNLGATFNYGNPGDLAVDDYVLITYSWKRGGDNRTALGVQSAVKTDPVNGKLTGFIDRFADDADRCTTTRVDYAEKPDSYHFHLGYGASKNTENVGGTFAFFYDTYGNVIGMTDKIVTAAKTYAVIDKAWGYWNNGDSGLKADLVFLDATKANVEVAKLWGVPTKNIAEIDVLPDFVYDTDWFDIEDYRAYKPAYGHLMTYSVNADGSYVLDNAGATPYAPVFIKKGNPNLWEKPDYTGTYIPTNEKTQYLLKNPDGSYVAYTGFEEIPTCCLSKCEWIKLGVYATVVYGEVSYYDADGAVAFVTKPDHRDYVTFEGNPNVYAQYEGYVNGVKTPIYVNVADDAAPGFFGGIVGLYKLTFKTDEYGVLVCTARTKEWDIYNSPDTVVKCDINSLVVSGHNAIAIKDKPVYVYEVVTGSFTAGTIEDLTAGTEVFLYGSAPYKADGSGLKAIFVIDYDL